MRRGDRERARDFSVVSLLAGTGDFERARSGEEDGMMMLIWGGQALNRVR